MPERKDLKIFIASSGELETERKESALALIEIGKEFNHLHLDPVLFELDTPSGNNPGDKRIQDTINPLLDESDIVVVLFYSKAGAFTREELERAKKGNKKIFLYLKEGFQPKSVNESVKYTELLQLKEQVENESEIRYNTFTTATYNGIFYKDLNKYLGDKYPLSETNSFSTSSTSATIETEVNNKLSDYPKPSLLFTGRDSESEIFKQTFNIHRLFVVEGLGGTGKTQFISKCINDFIPDKSKITWLDGSEQSKFDVFVENAGYSDVLKGEKSETALFSGLKDLIERDERIIFLDNFNDYEYKDPTFSKFLEFAYPYLKKSTIVIITKTEPSIGRITSLPTIKLEGLHEDALKYAKKFVLSDTNYSSISVADLEKICEGTEGHPLAIESSIWLMGRGKSANEILQHLPEFKGIKKIEDFSKRLFLDIFNHSTTSDEERECFLKCSVFKGKIKPEEVNYIYDGKDTFSLLVGLGEKLLLTIKDKGYEMHPLVRSFSYEKLTDKKSVHKKAAEYFITQRTSNLEVALEERIFYHLSEAEEWETIADTIELNAEDLIRKGHVGLLNDFLSEVINVNITRPAFDIFQGNILEIQGVWDEAIVHYEKAKNQDSVNLIKAKGILNYGEILYKKGMVKAAQSIFEEGYSYSKDNKFLKEEAIALDSIGSVNLFFGELSRAYKKYAEGLEICLTINYKLGIATSYGNIGSIYTTQGDLKKALEMHNKSLAIEKEIGNKQGIAASYGSIGSIYTTQGDLEKALEMHNKSLAIEKEIGNKQGIASSYGSIGRIYHTQGDMEKSMEMHNKSLAIEKEIGNKQGIASSYGSIGGIYHTQGDMEKSMEMHNKSLAIEKEIGNKQGIASSYGSIGNIYDAQGDLEKALEMHNKSLGIEKEIGNKQGIAASYGSIGNIYDTQGDLEKALEMHNKSLAIEKEIGNKQGIATSYGCIGSIYDTQGDLEKALEMHNKCISINQEIGNKQGIAASCGNIGRIYQQQGDFEKALEMHNKSLAIKNEIGDKQGIAASYGSIGSIYSMQGDLKKALEMHNKSLAIKNEIGNKKGIAASYGNIGSIYQEQGDLEKALEMHNKCLSINQEIGNKQGIAASCGYIGRIYQQQGDLEKALGMYNNSLTSSQEIGNKQGIAASCSSIGSIYNAQGNLEKALEMHNKSLTISQEMGNKHGIATSLNNVGAIYSSDESKKYDLALINFFKALVIVKSIGAKNNIEITTDWILGIRSKLGVSIFKPLAQNAFNELEPEMKEYLPLNVFLNEPVRVEAKTGRNDPCPCGSGKKYKNCHGR